MMLHWNALPENGRLVLERLQRLPMLRHAYLAGGTGLALQLGHRISRDLDFFTEKRHITLSEPSRLLAELRRVGPFSIRSESEGILHGQLLKVHISIVPHPFRLLQRTQTLGFIRLAGMEEIAAMKLRALLSRGAKRDFFDVAAVLEGTATLRRLMTLADRKYPGSRDLPHQTQKGLVDWAQAEHDADPRMLWPGWTWEEVKRRLEREARRLARRTLG